MDIKSTYKDAGVDLDIANELVTSIKSRVEQTYDERVISKLGGFAGLFDVSSFKDMEHPILTSSTDGVGTKLLIANALNNHKQIGIDLVAMCVNDIIVTGSMPLFFLDYFATGNIKIDVLNDIVDGIVHGCKQSGCALIGGESAELPGMYQNNDYDLAGFCVGVVDKNNIIDGSKIEEGDIIIGVESSGFHSNGYSLIRKIVNDCGLHYDDRINGDDILTLGDHLLTPTYIYVKPVLDIIKIFPVNGMVNITGGGFYDNISRIIPKNLSVDIFFDNWIINDVFKFFQNVTLLSWREMLQIFNCGIGYMIICNEKYEYGICDILQQHKLKSWNIGKVKERRGDQVNIIF